MTGAALVRDVAEVFEQGDAAEPERNPFGRMFDGTPVEYDWDPRLSEADRAQRRLAREGAEALAATGATAAAAAGAGARAAAAAAVAAGKAEKAE